MGRDAPVVSDAPTANPALRAAWSVRSLIDGHALCAHFQPIASLADGSVTAHEALIRTPAGCALATPDDLFAAAHAQGVSVDLEIECMRVALRSWADHGAPTRLFLNLSARALIAVLAQRDLASILTIAGRGGIAPRGIVIELTEHEHVRDVAALVTAVARLRRHDVAVALDDFGDGRSSLRLWSELKPEVVKIDKYFSHGVHEHPEKLQVLRALSQISQTMGATLVAEGIETEYELRVLRDLGIGMGQGWLLGRPAPVPVHQVLADALSVIRSKDIAVFPERRRAVQRRATATALLREAPCVAPSTTNEQLFATFAADSSLRALAIVDEDGWPVGLVSRQRFVEDYAKRYFRDLYGRKPCAMFANASPKLVDIDAGIDELTELLTSDDQRYLAEGIIITEGGRYRGLAGGEEIVRTVTESRIEAARHANPLTLLPGNIPITQHIERLLAAGSPFVACYADLNSFKPYNDLYGYWRGDEMILLASRCITQQADPRRDFVGHVGGDDFIVLFQSEDWETRCHALVETFNREAATLYDSPAQAAGGVTAEDRHGVMRFHPLTTVSLGVVRVNAAAGRAEDVASAAASAKRQAKQHNLGLVIEDWAVTTG
jgi:diguanylate cyclase (GGDEF)-like protein